MFNFHQFQASLVQDWSSSKVVLVLVRCASETAIFVIKSAQLPISREQDLDIVHVVQLDQTFKFDIESGHSSLGDGVFININNSRYTGSPKKCPQDVGIV